MVPWAAQVVGWQQTLDERHTCPATQLPQFSVAPHPSDMLPQFTPWAAQVAAWHAAGVWDMRLPI